MICSICERKIPEEELILAIRGDNVPLSCNNCEDNKSPINSNCDRCGDPATEYYFGHSLCLECIEEER